MIRIATVIAILLSCLGARAGAQDLRFVTLDFAPFIYGEDQKVAGPGRDVIVAACEAADLECSYDIFPWRRAQELMREGKADGMMVIGRNAEREEWLDFSPPLFRTEYGFFVSENSFENPQELAGIAGFKVGVFAPSNTAVQLEGLRDRMIAEGLEPLEIDARPDDVSGFRKLAAGRIDAVYSNRDRGRKVLIDNGLAGDVRYALSDKGILYFAAIRKSFQKPEVSRRFFAGLSEVFANGRASEIIMAYELEPGS